MKTIIAILTLGTLTCLFQTSKAQDPVPPEEAARRQAEEVRRQTEDVRRQAETVRRQAEDARRAADDVRQADKLIADQQQYKEAKDSFDQIMSSTGSGAGGWTFGGGTLGGGSPGVLQLIQGMNPGDGTRSAGRSLLIHNSDLDPQDQARLEEDLAVMSHILDKAVGQNGGASRSGSTAMGIGVYWDNVPKSARSIYLEDYGALFLLNVSFPLLPGAKPEAPKEKSATDSAWEEARQELYGSHDADGKPPRAGEEYDEAKVNKLKDALIEALRDASNIRQLKPDDWITVCVTGGASDGPVRTVRASSGRQPSASVRVSYHTGNHSTTLTVRVRKSDVDAFAHEKISRDEFRKKVKVSAYALTLDDSPAKAPWFSGYAPGRY